MANTTFSQFDRVSFIGNGAQYTGTVVSSAKHAFYGAMVKVKVDQHVEGLSTTLTLEGILMRAEDLTLLEAKKGSLAKVTHKSGQESTWTIVTISKKVMVLAARNEKGETDYSDQILAHVVGEGKTVKRWRTDEGESVHYGFATEVAPVSEPAAPVVEAEETEEEAAD